MSETEETFLESLMASKKKIRVANLGCNTDVGELYEFFGFNNPVLQQSCSVKLVCDEDTTDDTQKYYAILQVPENFEANNLKGSGEELTGREL